MPVPPLALPGLYPRTYRASKGYLIFLGLCGGCITIGALAGLWYFGTGHETRSRSDAMMMVSISAAFVLLGAYNLALIFRYKIVLAPEAITAQGALRSRTLLRDEIALYRNVAAGDTVCLWVYPGVLHAQWYQVTTCPR